MMQYIPIALNLIGIIILLFGFREAYKLRNKLGTGKLKEAWDKLSVFIAIFIAGYAAFSATLLMGGDNTINSNLITSLVFLLGSGFVLLAAHYNRQAFEH
jgi:hypothetical protein